MALRAEDGQWVSRGIENLKLNHVKADPRSRTQLQNALDISQYKACIVLTGGLMGGWVGGCCLQVGEGWVRVPVREGSYTCRLPCPQARALIQILLS